MVSTSGAVKRGVKRRIAASRTRICGRSVSRRMSEQRGFITRSTRRPHLRSMRHRNALYTYNKWFGPRACGDKSHASRTMDLDAPCVCWFGERHARDRSRHAGAIRRRTRCALDDAMRCDAMRCARADRACLFFVLSRRTRRHGSPRRARCARQRSRAQRPTISSSMMMMMMIGFGRRPARARRSSR